MKNILEEKPTEELHGRTLFNSRFMSDSDIRNRKILDIGCGFGWFELHAIKRGAAYIEGIELTRDDLKTAKRYIGNAGIAFRVGNAMELPYKDSSFDTVVSWEVLEHLPENSEARMFKEVRRVLKERGVFYLSVPNDSFFCKLLDPAWWLIGHRHYSKSTLVSLAENNNFQIEKYALKGGWWEIISIWNLYISKWIFRRKPFLQGLISQKQDDEYEKKEGFTNIFIEYKKI